jgi:hypothetical protein
LQNKIKQQNMSKEMNIIHLYVKESNTHHYFGGLKAMYQYFDTEQLGITYDSIRTRGIAKTNLYENKKIIVRKGKLYSMPQKAKEIKPKTTPNTTE